MRYARIRGAASRAVQIRPLWLLLCFFFCCFWSYGIFGIWAYGAEEEGEDYSQETERVFDYAGLFDQEEIKILEETAARLQKEMKAEVIVVTVDDADGQSARQVADQFYFSHGFEQTYHENGILMLIDMDNRELYLGTYGSMIRVLTDQRIERILDQVYDAASKERYADAALAGIEMSGEYFQKGIQSNQYHYNVETGAISRYRSIRWYEALFAFAVSAGTAAGVCWKIVGEYGMKDVGSQGDSLAYRADCRFQFHNPSDQLVNTLVTHIVIPRQPTGGGHSGGSFSGRSSTHSYGGHQAGGGGRKF